MSSEEQKPPAPIEAVPETLDDPVLISIRDIIRQGFSVVNEALVIRPEANSNSRPLPNTEIFTPDIRNDPAKVFLAMTPRDLWQHIALHTDQRALSKLREGSISSTYHDKYLKNITAENIVHCFAIRLAVRGRLHHKDMEEQYQDKPDGLIKWPLNVKRFKALVSTLDCDFVEFSSLLRRGWQSSIDSCSEICVDESLYAYYSQSKSEVKSPQRYIPRKPNKNGLLCYVAAVETDEGSYVVDLESDYLIIKTLNSHTALLSILSRWPWPQKPSVTIDAGFSDTEMFHVLQDRGWFSQLLSTESTREMCLIYSRCFRVPKSKWLSWTRGVVCGQ